MALSHAKVNELIPIHPLGPAISSAKTTTLLKTKSLEIIRIVLPTGKKIPAHQVSGETTVQCLEGRVALQAGDSVHHLETGNLVCLGGGCPHALQGVSDATVLVTIVLGK